jgi:hypothetical protein
VLRGDPGELADQDRDGGADQHEHYQRDEVGPG